jgi:hypothetical protein
MIKQTITISAIVALLTIGSVANQHITHSQVKKQTQQHTNTAEETTLTVEESNTLLTQQQEEDLIFLAEEEKVARDVYIYLNNKWKQRVFSNISTSEQKHMDAVEKLLNTYNLPVPETMDEEGIFIDENLQAMYDALIEKGEQSLEDALEVGVEIEEIDIDDIQLLLQDTPPSDIAQVYENLLAGSNNHLNAFNRELSK